MKFSANVEEIKGPFGGTYYELDVKVTLTDEEIKSANEYKKYNTTLIGGRNSEESSLLYRLTRLSPIIKGEPKTKLSIKDLSEGFKFKANNRDELSELLAFQELVKERCKAFKEYIESQQKASEMFGQGKLSYEEEL